MFIFFLIFFSHIDPKCPGDVDFLDNDWDIKTITSSLKFYLRYARYGTELRFSSIDEICLWWRLELTWSQF